MKEVITALKLLQMAWEVEGFHIQAIAPGSLCKMGKWQFWRLKQLGQKLFELRCFFAGGL